VPLRNPTGNPPTPPCSLGWSHARGSRWCALFEPRALLVCNWLKRTMAQGSPRWAPPGGWRVPLLCVGGPSQHAPAGTSPQHFFCGALPKHKSMHPKPPKSPPSCCYGHQLCFRPRHLECPVDSCAFCLAQAPRACRCAWWPWAPPERVVLWLSEASGGHFRTLACSTNSPPP
jgi:hypothetical protein